MATLRVEGDAPRRALHFVQIAGLRPDPLRHVSDAPRVEAAL
jgi:hypothetical protein